MTGSVTSLWRHPIKAHGREPLQTVTLIAGQTMPGDRIWAVAHEASKADGSTWVPCANFSRAAKAPDLMAITSRLHEDGARITLSHPSRPDLSFAPDGPPEVFLDWVRPLMPTSRAASARLIRVPGRGLTDSDFPSVSLCNMASHRAVEKQIGQDLSIHRWRGNIWFDGLPDWAEFDWIGREVQIGGAVLQVRQRATRCAATTANPETGERDAAILETLDRWGHRDFSVYAQVVRDGPVHIGDKLQVL